MVLSYFNLRFVTIFFGTVILTIQLQGCSGKTNLVTHSQSKTIYLEQGIQFYKNQDYQ